MDSVAKTLWNCILVMYTWKGFKQGCIFIGSDIKTHQLYQESIWEATRENLIHKTIFYALRVHATQQ